MFINLVVRAANVRNEVMQLGSLDYTNVALLLVFINELLQLFLEVAQRIVVK